VAWTSRSARVATLLASCLVEPLAQGTARRAGEALASVRDAGVVDAIVMASASTRTDRVLTSDARDLGRLQRAFPDVTVTPL
jgi:hypothetical protein